MSEIGYKCPTCHKIKCFDHCNSCGSIIYWTGATKQSLGTNQFHYIDEKGSVRNKETNRKRSLNFDGKIHYCLLDGAPDGQYKNVTRLKLERS